MKTRILLLAILTITFLPALAVSATFSECFKSTCAIITVPDQIEPNVEFEVLVEGYIENATSWDTSAYTFMEDNEWNYSEDHLVRYAGSAIDTKGFNWGGEFNKKYTLSKPAGTHTLTFVFGSRGWQHGYYDVAVQAQISTSSPARAVAFDIKPQSCPNPLKAGRKGILSAAIVGSEKLDVTQIDTATIQVAGISPLHVAYEDVTSPYSPYTGKSSATDCTTEGLDGHLDLTLKFKAQEIYAALQEAQEQMIEDGQVVNVKMTAALTDDNSGTSQQNIYGEDIILIRGKRLKK